MPRRNSARIILAKAAQGRKSARKVTIKNSVAGKKFAGRPKKGVAKVTLKKKKKKKITKPFGKRSKKSSSGYAQPPTGPGPEMVFDSTMGKTTSEYEVESILDCHKQGEKRIYLVKWIGWGTEWNTWEPETNLRNAQDKIQEFDEAFPDKP